MTSPLLIAPSVEAALAAGRPVVALESTVIAHGLPWPQNRDTLQEIEEAVRQAGAEPAVIGISGGRLIIGLEAALLDHFTRNGQKIAKVSRRDMAAVLAKGADGATTVAATMLAAARAGIPVFATGGIGGVHRSHDPREEGLDVSADLYELARTPVCVVSSGAKSILDLPRTLEMLESLGVPLVGYRTRSFPTFYSRDADLPLRGSVETAEEAARLLALQMELGLGGMLLANPVPEATAIPTAEVEGWLEEALARAREEGIGGPAVTPFLLAQLHHLSAGRTLEANRALLVANARLAAEVAVALSRLN